MTGRERVLAMLDGAAVDRLPLMPITMMYAADLAGVSYREYASSAAALAEAQLKVSTKFEFDYVSVISDPARETSDMGGKVVWFDDQPPAIVESEALLADKATLASLKLPDLTATGRMRDRIQGVRLLRRAVGAGKIVEGWVEGPCALGADLRGLNTLMLDFYDDPAFVEQLFDFVVRMEIQFAWAQVEAGADLIGVGDAAASLIGPKFYQRFVQPFEYVLIEAIHAMGARVRLHICGNTRRILADMGLTGADIIDLDFLASLDEARIAMGPQQVLLGNLDPVRVLRDGTPESVYAAIAECHRAARGRYIVGAGCEIPRGTPEDNVLALTRYAQEHGA